MAVCAIGAATARPGACLPRAATRVTGEAPTLSALGSTSVPICYRAGRQSEEPPRVPVALIEHVTELDIPGAWQPRRSSTGGQLVGPPGGHETIPAA